MRRLGLPVLILTLMTACVSSSRVKVLEKRLVEMEDRETRRDLELNGTLLRLEAQLAALAAGYARVSDLGLEDLTEKLASIEDKIEKVVARPAPRPARPQADPAKTYAVPIAGAPVKGSADALVTVVRAGEYACPFCEKTRATMDELARRYGKKVRFVHLDFVVHPQTATDAAKAGCAAQRQGKFWELDELLWEKAFKTRQFEASHLETLAAEAGLDLDRYRADVAGTCGAEIQRQMAMLQTLGVGATPAFFVNGRFLSGAQPLPAFEKLVDEELKLAEERVKQGTKPKKYYEVWVVQKGLTKLEPAPAAP